MLGLLPNRSDSSFLQTNRGAMLMLEARCKVHKLEPMLPMTCVRMALCGECRKRSKATCTCSVVVLGCRRLFYALFSRFGTFVCIHA